MPGRGGVGSDVLCRKNILPYDTKRRDQTLELQHLILSLPSDAKNLSDFERIRSHF